MKKTTAKTPQAAIDYSKLPESVPLEDTTAMQASTDAPDPTMGRDTETEFMLRYG